MNRDALLALASSGFSVIALDNSEDHDLPFWPSDMLLHDDRPRDRLGFRHPHPTSRREITFTDTPKPLSKRRARRLRGKTKS